MLQFIHRHGQWLFFGYVGGAVTFLLLIESTFNAGFMQSFKWMWFPLAALIFGFMWVTRYFFYEKARSHITPWVTATIVYLIALLMVPPYVMAYNAFTTSGETIIYSGPIVRKWIHHGARSGDSYEIDLRDTHSGEMITIEVPRHKYDSLSVGDVITEKYLKGGLGIPFRWRFAKPR
jgi:hypothetical protein